MSPSRPLNASPTPDAITLVSQRARSKVAARRARARLRLLEEASRPVVAEVRMGVEDRQRAAGVCCTVRKPWSRSRTPRKLAAAWRRHAWRGLSSRRTSRSMPALVQQFESASDAVREAIAQRDDERAAEVERARAVAREQADRVAICDEILTAVGIGCRRPYCRVEGALGQPAADAVRVRGLADASFPGCVPTVRERERRRLLADAAVGRLETLATELEQLTQSDLAA